MFADINWMGDANYQQVWYGQAVPFRPVVQAQRNDEIDGSTVTAKLTTDRSWAATAGVEIDTQHAVQ